MEFQTIGCDEVAYYACAGNCSRSVPLSMIHANEIMPSIQYLRPNSRRGKLPLREVLYKTPNHQARRGIKLRLRRIFWILATGSKPDANLSMTLRGSVASPRIGTSSQPTGVMASLREK
jgi:hypothetical protein